MRKRARVILSLEVLRRLLHLEDDVTIEAVVQTAEDVCQGTASLLLRGDGLPDDSVQIEGQVADLCRLVTTSEVEYAWTDEQGVAFESHRVVRTKVERA